MAELPFHIESDHLPEVRGRNGIVQVCPALGCVERIADRLARKLHAETPVKSDEPVLPMLAVAVERAAHVEKDRANHSAVSYSMRGWRETGDLRCVARATEWRGPGSSARGRTRKTNRSGGTRPERRWHRSAYCPRESSSRAPADKSLLDNGRGLRSAPGPWRIVPQSRLL